ncbi:MAG: ROK family protein [Peptostreptococcaceae bacterium]|nr:ROK family protein [Peptostreptococcaceae bacterium]
MFLGAIDIGGTKTIVAVCDEKGNIIEMENFPTENGDWMVHFRITAEKFIQCVNKLQIDINEDLSGIGINVPGMVDENGILIYAPHQNWRDVHVKDYFSNYFKTDKIIVENDVNSCAVGEMIFGGGGHDFLWITISTGNGGAIIANGQLIRGNQSCAGEFGHLKVEFESPRKCSCGQYGCLEAHSSGTAIKEQFEEALLYDLNLKETVLNKQIKDEKFKIDAYGLSLLAREGNSVAIDIFTRTGMYLGRAISYGVNISNPQTVYLGGGIAESLDLILPAIIMELDKCAIEECGKVTICKTKLGYNAAIIGASALVYLQKDILANL